VEPPRGQLEHQGTSLPDEEACLLVYEKI